MPISLPHRTAGSNGPGHGEGDTAPLTGDDPFPFAGRRYEEPTFLHPARHL